MCVYRKFKKFLFIYLKSKREVILAMMLFANLGYSAKVTVKSTSAMLKNSLIERHLKKQGNRWKTVGFTSNGAFLKIESDEFHILLMDDTELTIADYQAENAPVAEDVSNNKKSLKIFYQLRADKEYPANAPKGVEITYIADNSPYLRKKIALRMEKGTKIDRLEVERFVTAEESARGGRGEPVFIGNKWFFGVEFPAAYSRCGDGNQPKAYSGAYDKIGNYSFISLDDRDIEKNPHEGLVRLFHFPGPARAQTGGGYGIVSKTAVCGAAKSEESVETAFYDYINAIKLPPRSFIHFNNWTVPSAKNLTVDNFVHKIYAEFKKNIAPYDIKIDAMVPDNYWQDSKSIYQPSRSKSKFPEGDTSLGELAKALQTEGSSLGLWMALNGYSMNTKWGAEQGYTVAKANNHFRRFGNYYSVGSPKYFEAMTKRVDEIVRLTNLSYLKHDFNEMCDMGPDNGSLPTDRHGHERAVECTISLLETARKANPDIFLNVTNWVWFSPWWLQHCDSIWMLAGDGGWNVRYPAISFAEQCVSYRDHFIYNCWGNTEDRPLIPVSNLMTHGIQFSESYREVSLEDSLEEWSNYLMMYYGRGIQLKEWYISPWMMNKCRWKTLGSITKWADENVKTMANSFIVGGKPDLGEAYGYISWEGDKGILTCRNPSLEPKSLEVPFDQSVLFKGEKGRQFVADIVYPYSQPYQKQFVSGKPILITIPPLMTMTMHFSPGMKKSQKTVVKTPFKVQNDQNGFEIEIQAGDKGKCDLYVLMEGASTAEVYIDGKIVNHTRNSHGYYADPKKGMPWLGYEWLTNKQLDKSWWLYKYNLRKFNGRKFSLKIVPSSPNALGLLGKNPHIKAYLLADCKVSDKEVCVESGKPYPILQNYCRFSHKLMDEPVTFPKADKAIKGASFEAENVIITRVSAEIFYNPEGVTLYCNGKELARLRPTPSSFIHRRWWDRVVMDVPVENFNAAGSENKITVKIGEKELNSIKIDPKQQLRLNGSKHGNTYVKNISIAVKLKDGRWKKLGTSPAVFSNKKVKKDEILAGETMNLTEGN